MPGFRMPLPSSVSNVAEGTIGTWCSVSQTTSRFTGSKRNYPGQQALFLQRVNPVPLQGLPSADSTAIAPRWTRAKPWSRPGTPASPHLAVARTPLLADVYSKLNQDGGATSTHRSWTQYHNLQSECANLRYTASAAMPKWWALRTPSTPQRVAKCPSALEYVQQVASSSIYGQTSCWLASGVFVCRKLLKPGL